jgi:mRNA-degrading endonuclease toxin of MazEF toxin-antitoxin module
VNAGDIVEVDFGLPIGSEARFRRPGVVVTADAFLRLRPTTVLVVPLTSTRRSFPSHVEIDADGTNRLSVTSYAPVEQLRAIAVERCGPPAGNVGQAVVDQILDVLAMITGMP